MPLPTSRHEIAVALRSLFRLRGNATFDVEQGISPVVVVADTQRIPVKGGPGPFGVPVVGRLGRAAAVGEYAFVWVSPAPGVLLTIDRIHIANANADGAEAAFYVGYLTATDITTIVAATTGKLFRQQPTPGIEPDSYTASRIQDGTHNAIVLDAIDYVKVPAGSTAMIEIPNGGIVLDGTDTQGGLAVMGLEQGVAKFTYATFFGREFPSAG